MSQVLRHLLWNAGYAQADAGAMHLVLVGVEASLWTAQQFAEDLKVSLPCWAYTMSHFAKGLPACTVLLAQILDSTPLPQAPTCWTLFGMMTLHYSS